MPRLKEIREELKTIPQLREKLRKCQHPEILNLKVSKEKLTAFLSDGRNISIPLVWFAKWGSPNVKPEQLKKYEIWEGRKLVYFPETDDHLGVETFTDGLKGICPDCH